MLLRQLTVNYREHARDLPALRLEPGDKPFDLLHRILAPLADEENVRGRPRQLTRDLPVRPRPPRERRQLRVRLIRRLGRRQHHRRPVARDQSVFEQIGQHGAPARTGRTEHEINEGFFGGSHVRK